MNRLDPKVRAFLHQPDLPEQDHAKVLPKMVSIKPKGWHIFILSLSWGFIGALIFAALQCAGCFDGSYR